MNKRKIGRLLEEKILGYIKEIDPQARLSRASGASFDIGDVVSQDFYFEAKKRNTVDFTIKEAHLNHLNSQVPINSKKICILVNENKNGNCLVTLSIDDFFRLIKEV